MSIRDEPPRCRQCGEPKRDAKWDYQLKMCICNDCWFHTPPPHSTPPPSDRCKGK